MITWWLFRCCTIYTENDAANGNYEMVRGQAASKMAQQAPKMAQQAGKSGRRIGEMVAAGVAVDAVIKKKDQNTKKDQKRGK